MPAALAVLPLGLALGVVVAQSGLAWWWGTALAAIVFAGSLEFLLVGMLAAVAPFSQIALTALLVNFRHVFYAISFPLHLVRGKAARAYSVYALTDEAYALTAPAVKESWSTARILAIQAGFHVGWVASVTIGGLVGGLIPDWVQGLDFAVVALFAVLTVDAFKVQRTLPVPVLALLCALVGVVVTPGSMLVTSMALFVLGLSVSYLFKARRAGAEHANN